MCLSASLREDGGRVKRIGFAPKGRISLLEKLILSPEHLRKSSKIVWIAGISVLGEEENTSMSSANSATLMSSRPIGRPCNRGEEERRRERGSIARLKSKGESGQPCLVPLCSRKGGDWMLAAVTVAEGAEYILCMKELKEPVRPKRCKTKESH